MPSDAPSSSAQPTDITAWFSQHPVAALWIGAFCLWVSVCLILRLWIIHRNTPLHRRLFWSLVLLFPLFGWLAYAGFFRIPSLNDFPCSENPDAGTGGGWD